jgi:predicted PurR-regulated permease PerM
VDLAPPGEDAARNGAESPSPPPPAEETPDGILLPPGTRHEPALGRLGHPVNRRTPFYIGLTGALGVAIAYLLVRAIADVAGVLLLIGLALFIAVGLNPAVEWLERKGRRRGVAVGLIVAAFLAFVAGFVAAAIPPTVHEVHDLVHNLPTYRHNLEQGKGWLGHIVTRLHLQSYVKRSEHLKIDFAGGFLGAGKLILSGVTGTVTVCVLTVYFLIALPGVKRLWLGVVPLSRRGRAELLTDEVFDRVGGFVLGNIITSIVTGVGTTIWLLAFGVPYAVLLGLFVAIIDLVPIVGSTVGGVVVSLVALVKGLPVAIATACFYVAYRFFEDYLLTPRVMRHTVRISPGTTIIAVLLGGALLGLAGALVAIPVAATVYLLLEEIVLPRANRT